MAEPAETLNRSHLLGLLIARYKALQDPTDTCVFSMVHQHARTSALTPRQLKDVVEDLQMHWGTYCEEEKVAELLDGCVTRFGALNLYASTYDDINMRDHMDETRMSLPVIRRFVSIFCVLYRHLHMMYECEDVDGDITVDCDLTIHEFHVQASMETFYKIYMHSDLPPASRLLYRQDFAAFYHCVSQVVYFHFPSYERMEQNPMEEIRKGSLNALAPLMEMYPEVVLKFEDDTLQPDAWNWVLMGKRVYLVSKERKIYYSQNIISLMKLYVKEATALT